jgi:deoxyribose-phosphate aldolase
MTSMTEKIERLIDHALLHPTMTDDEIREGCKLAARLNLISVCVKPYAIPLAVEVLRGSNTAVGTVIGFPHGSQPTEIKVAESIWAMNAGAVELDMVVNVGKVLQGDWVYVERDIRLVVEAAHRRNAIVKVIFETDFITDEKAKRSLCKVSELAGADFVKTSTGFGFVKQKNGDYNYTGATFDDIRLMRETCSAKVGVKASGGVRSYDQARAYQELGATRLGTSASETILHGQGNDQTGY